LVKKEREIKRKRKRKKLLMPYLCCTAELWRFAGDG